jgi:hypothetical protein
MKTKYSIDMTPRDAAGEAVPVSAASQADAVMNGLAQIVANAVDDVLQTAEIGDARLVRSLMESWGDRFQTAVKAAVDERCGAHQGVKDLRQLDDFVLNGKLPERDLLGRIVRTIDTRVRASDLLVPR